MCQYVGDRSGGRPHWVVASTWLLVTVFTATCFSNVAVMGSLDVRPSVCP